MKYDFKTETGQFFLYDPETGKEWLNYLFNDFGYICSVAHRGGSSSKYLNEDAISISYNDGQSFFYLRDEESKKFWNIGGYPSVCPMEEYCCEHAQTYTKISSVTEGIAGEILYTVDPADTRELWRVTLTNRTPCQRILSLFPYTQFSLGGFSQPFYYNMKTTSATEFVEEARGLWCENQNPFKPHERCSGYIVTSLPVKAYSGNGETFIGTMGTASVPRTLALGLDCSNDLSDARSRAGILQSQIILQAGESITVYYAVGLVSPLGGFLTKPRLSAVRSARICLTAKRRHFASESAKFAAAKQSFAHDFYGTPAPAKTKRPPVGAPAIKQVRQVLFYNTK